MFPDREGVKWYNLRTVLNKRMLHPKDSVQYGDVVNEVVSDLIKRIYHLRRTSTPGDRVNNLANELYRFSLEGTWEILPMSWDGDSFTLHYIYSSF